MDYKKAYEETVKNMCLKDRDEFDFIVEQEMPKFVEKLIPNENAPSNALYSFILDETATDKDYKDFCEYIYAYVGMVFEENHFSNFKKPIN